VYYCNVRQEGGFFEVRLVGEGRVCLGGKGGFDCRVDRVEVVDVCVRLLGVLFGIGFIFLALG